MAKEAAPKKTKVSGYFFDHGLSFSATTTTYNSNHTDYQIVINEADYPVPCWINGNILDDQNVALINLLFINPGRQDAHTTAVNLELARLFSQKSKIL